MSSSELSYDQLVERWVAIGISDSRPTRLRSNLFLFSFASPRIHYSEKYTDDEWEYRSVWCCSLFCFPSRQLPTLTISTSLSLFHCPNTSNNQSNLKPTIKSSLLHSFTSQFNELLLQHHARHVILPKPLLKQIPKEYFDPEEPGVLRILKDQEWRGIGITQSLGWEHYEVHGELTRILVEMIELRFRVWGEGDRGWGWTGRNGQILYVTASIRMFKLRGKIKITCNGEFKDVQTSGRVFKGGIKPNFG